MFITFVEINGFLSLYDDKENNHRNLDQLFMNYMSNILDYAPDQEEITEMAALFCHLQAYLRSMKQVHPIY